MSLVLKIISLFVFLGWIINSLAKFSSQPVISAVSIVLNTVIFIGIRKGLSYTISHPENSSLDRKSKIIRWLIAIFFSIYVMQISIVLSFILLFLFNISYMNRSPFAMSLFKGLGPQVTNILNVNILKIFRILGLLISVPLLYLINKTIKFSKPFITTVILLIIWSIILVLLIPGNPSGAKVIDRNDQATINTINVKISPTSYNAPSSEKKIFKDDDFGFQFLYENDSIMYSNRANSRYLLLVALNNPKLRKLIRDKDGREYLSRDSERYFSLEVVNKDNGCPVTINDLNNGVAIKTVIDSKEVEMIEGDGAYDTHRRSICLEKEGNIYWFVNDYWNFSSEDIKTLNRQLFDQTIQSFKFNN